MSLPMVRRTPLGPTAEAAGPGLLRALLEKLENAVSAVGSPAGQWLEDGIAPDEVEAQLSAVGLIPSDELIVWFGWHNGIRHAATAGIGARVLPFLIPASLSEAIGRYRSLVLDFVVPPEGPVGGDPRVLAGGTGFGWLNLCNDNYGFAVACRSEPRYLPRVRLIVDEWDDDPRSYQAVSLCTLVTWWIQAIEDGAVRWDNQNNLWTDPDPELLPPLQVEVGMV